MSKNKQKQARRADLKKKRELRKELGLNPTNEFHYVVVRNLAGQTMQIPVDRNGDPVSAPDIVLDLSQQFKGVKTLPKSVDLSKDERATPSLEIVKSIASACNMHKPQWDAPIEKGPGDGSD